MSTVARSLELRMPMNLLSKMIRLLCGVLMKVKRKKEIQAKVCQFLLLLQFQIKGVRGTGTVKEAGTGKGITVY